MNNKLKKATLAGGCFWCTEAVFQRLKGVEQVTPGYSGGYASDPTYEQVGTGGTGHAEAIEILYDPEVISYGDILDVFWAVHDPTQLNRQGNDVGTQYRSVIFYHSEEQRKIAENSKNELEKSGKFEDEIVTEISAAGDFYLAEREHMDYYNQNRDAAYCRLVIDPKITKLYKEFSNNLNV